MPKLSDTQLIILSAACAREDRRVLPLPKSLKGGAAKKVIEALVANALIEEVEAQKGDLVWRDDGEARRLTLVATPAADAALDGSTTDAAPAAPQRPAKAKDRKAAAKPKPKGRKATGASLPRLRTRPDRHQAGTAHRLAEASQGRQHCRDCRNPRVAAHTIRGALAGALKKKLGLTIVSEPHETRGRIYRITE